MSKEIVTFSCPDWAIRKYAPVIPAEKYFPEEFKKLPVGEICPFDFNKSASQLTIRQCPAISNYMKAGYIITAWCDIQISFFNDSMKIEMSNNDYGYEIHSSDQIGGAVGSQFDLRMSIKLNSPWSIVTEEGYGLMWLPYFYHDKNYQALPAVVDTDSMLNRNPINLMLFEKKDTLIKTGDPLVQVVPFKREDVQAVSKAYTEKDHKRYTSFLNLNKLSRFGWRSFIKNKTKYWLDAKDLEVDQ